ncbi:MAG: hypothetical protein V3U82_08265 [Robiginitomaculum sp.]
MKTYLKMIIILAASACVGPSGYAQKAARSGPVALEIIDGDTSFIVDSHKNKVWWVVGECRREIPMAKKQAGSPLLTSQKIVDNVTIGRRQIALTQQFRFNISSAAASAEVYNSVRGGWAIVPVRENAQCAIDASCLTKMELPDC